MQPCCYNKTVKCITLNDVGHTVMNRLRSLYVLKSKRSTNIPAFFLVIHAHTICEML